MIALFIAWGVLVLAVVVRVILEARSSSGQARPDDDSVMRVRSAAARGCDAETGVRS